MDHLRHTSKLVALARITKKSDMDEVYDAAVKKLTGIKERLREQTTQPSDKIVPLDRSLITSFSAE
jgi:hypothetical protein